MCGFGGSLGEILKGNNCGLHCWIVGEERWQGRAMDYAASFFEGRGAHWNYNLLKNFDAITTPVQHHLCKVYSTLTATALLSAVGVYIHTVWNIGGIITSLLFFGASTWLAVMPATVENESKRLQLLSAAALCEGASVGTLVGIVTVAFLGSTAIFSCFTGAALLAKRREYLFWGGILSSAVSMMLLMQFGSIFWGGGRFLFHLELYLGLAVFVGYVLFDTQMIIERASLGDYDYIKHALDLFIDFVAIFVRIVIILVALEVEQEEDEAGTVGDTFTDYKPSKLSTGQPHPDPIVETASLSAVQPPEPTYSLLIGEEMEKSEALSCLQLETIVYASRGSHFISV